MSDKHAGEQMMPTFAGPFDARIESTKRLLAIYWRAVAEFEHIHGAVRCDDCRGIKHAADQAAYEKHEAELSLRSRSITDDDIARVAGLGRLAATQNPEIHDFTLPKA